MKSKPEIVLATWPNAEPGYAYWGCRDYTAHNTDCASTWLSLRLVDPVNDSYVSYEDRDIVSNTGIYIWFMKNSTMIVKASGHEIHSLDQERCEALLKFLRKMNKKLVGMPQYKPDQMFEMLMDLTKRLGIGLAIQYSRGDDGFVPAYIAVKQIADTLAKRYAKILETNPDKVSAQEEEFA